MASASTIYNTRQKRRSSEATPKARVDWKRTKVDSVSHILDSDESITSEEEPDESEEEESSSSDEEQQPETGPPADDGEDNIKKPRCKSKSATIGSSDSSSDSDGPGARVAAKRSRVIDEDEEPLNRNSEDEDTKAQIKKQQRKESLKQLAERRRSRNRTTIQDESEEGSASSEYTPLTPDTLAEDEDSQDMANFIEDDEEDEQDEDGNRSARHQDLFLKHNLSQFACNSLHTHLQKVIKAFLINIVDNTFLASLYERIREKRYAKDLLKSLNYLDERILAPRLEKLTTSCRWKKRYKERVDSYPRLLVRVIEGDEQCCDACELFRYCKNLVTLSGQEYDGETLENDDFLSDDKQLLVVGSTCASRTAVYHRVKHYKYHLYQRCIPYLHESKDQTVKDMVAMALSQMEEQKFISKEVSHLQRIVDEADHFQEEDERSLLS